MSSAYIVYEYINCFLSLCVSLSGRSRRRVQNYRSLNLCFHIPQRLNLDTDNTPRELKSKFSYYSRQVMMKDLIILNLIVNIKYLFICLSMYLSICLSPKYWINSTKCSDDITLKLCFAEVLINSLR